MKIFFSPVMKDNQDFSFIPELLAFSQPAWFCPVRLYRLLLCGSAGIRGPNEHEPTGIHVLLCVFERYHCEISNRGHSLWLNLKQSVCFSWLWILSPILTMTSLKGIFFLPRLTGGKTAATNHPSSVRMNLECCFWQTFLSVWIIIIIIIII